MINVDNIFVLTINRHQKRQDRIKDILSDINFEFYYGFDAPEAFGYHLNVNELSNEFFELNSIDKQYVSRWNIGQLGAYFSIREMIKVAYDKNLECVLIFEDDIKPLDHKFVEKINHSLSQLPLGWDLFLLGFEYNGFSYRLAYKRFLRPLVAMINIIKKSIGLIYIKILPKKYNRNLDYAGNSFGGHAFIISRPGMKKLLNKMYPLKNGGDVLINEMISEKQLNAFSIYPILFEQIDKKNSSTR